LHEAQQEQQGQYRKLLNSVLST